ncbi:MAG: hypothetical protein R3B98_00330 [Hyphomonas sp.]
MPPATMFVPDADADAAVDPLAEVMRAFAALKLEKAKTAPRHDRLAGRPAGA